MRKLKALAFVAAASAASIASAEAIIYDGFEYPTDGNPPLGIGPNNFAGSFGQWRYQGNNTNEPRLFAGSISYPGLPPSVGNKVQLDNNNGQAGAGANAARLYIGSRDSTNYPTLYYSFVTTIPSSSNPSTTGAYFAGFDNQTAAASYTSFAGLFVRRDAGDTTDINLGISTSGSQNRQWTAALPNDTPLFVVGSFTFGGISTLDVFVDPAAIPFAEPGTHTVVSSNVDTSTVTEVTNFYLRGNLTEPDAIEVDEVRIGTNWAEVASHAFYWDIDGANPGAGGTTPSGNWDGLATNFNTDPTGGSAGTITETTRAFDSVNFSAANEATGSYSINVTGTQSALVNVTAGDVTFNNGTLAVGRFDIAAGATATVNSAVIGAPMGVSKAGDGTLTLQGANSWTGVTRVSGGTMIIQGDLTSSSAVAVTGGTLQHNGNLATTAVTMTGGALQHIGTLTATSVTLSGGALQQQGDVSASTVAVSGGSHSQQGNLIASTSISVTGGTLQLASGGGSNRVMTTPALSISGSGHVDLSDNKLIVQGGDVGSWDGSAYTGVSGLVQVGRGAGGAPFWDGASGIITSMTDATASVLTSLAVARGSELFEVSPGVPIGPTDTVTWAGQTIDGDDVLVMYTWGGDAELDGDLDGDDYFWIDSNVALSGTSFGYHQGDFDYDGDIDGDDYFIIDSNIAFAQSQPDFPTSGGVGAMISVPEPGWGGIVGAVALLRRRRRKRREMTS